MSAQSDPVVDLIIRNWRERLPSVDDMQTVSDEVLFAEFPVRTIDLHLVLSRFDLMSILHSRALSVFGAELARLSPPSEFARAYAVRSFAINVVDSILCAAGNVTRDQLIENVIARTQLLPLAPIERVAS